MNHPQILTLDISGQPHSWMSWEDVITLKCKGNIAWEMGDGDFLFRGGISRMSGEQSKMNISSIVALRGKFKTREKVVLTNANLFKRDRNICAYCGKHYGDDKLTRDHIIAVSKGGKNTWTNCVTACKGCNNYKDDKSLEELGMELLYVPYTPNFAEGLVMKGRNILTDQMDFLSAFLPSHSRLRSQD